MFIRQRIATALRAGLPQPVERRRSPANNRARTAKIAADYCRAVLQSRRWPRIASVSLPPSQATTPLTIVALIAERNS